MTTRPNNSPLYATDATLSGGPQVGLSTRLSPGAGALAQGFWMGRRLPARALSFILGTLGDWVSYLDEQASRSAMKFSRTDLAVGSSTMSRLSAVQQTLAIGSAANRPKQILVSGVSSGAAAQCSLLNDGTVPPTVYSTIGSNACPSSPASDSSGVLFFGVASAFGLKKSTDAGNTTSSVTVPGLTGEASWVGFTSTRYLVFEASTSTLYRSTALGSGWSSSVLSGMVAVSDLVTNGAGTWILVGNLSFAATVVAYYSTDDGLTWTLAGSLGNGACGACYSANDGAFYALSSDGKLWSSLSGTAWALAKTVASLTNANGVSLGQNCFVCCGTVLAVTVNRGANALGKYCNGIAYTIDKGASWNEIYVGSPANVPITQLLSANGRIYAVDANALYQSELLTTPPTLFAGV